MSDSEQEQGKGVRSTGTRRFWIGVSLGILFIFSAANIFVLLFMVPKFEHVFEDALPGKPLPSVTAFILAYRILIAFATLGWPCLGAYLVRRQTAHPIAWINIGLILSLLQLGITIIALFMPMVGTTEGLGGQP